MTSRSAEVEKHAENLYADGNRRAPARTIARRVGIPEEQVESWRSLSLLNGGAMASAPPGEAGCSWPAIQVTVTLDPGLAAYVEPKYR